MKHCMSIAALLLAGCASNAPIALKDMGSFHVGGREITISGKPVREVTFTVGGAPAKIDPNGVYQVERCMCSTSCPSMAAARCRC